MSILSCDRYSNFEQDTSRSGQLTGRQRRWPVPGSGLICQALRHTALSVQMFYILLLVTTYTILLSISGASLQHSTFIQGLTEWRDRPALLLVSGRHWTKRHYRKKCPIFILVIGFIVLGLRRTLRHNFTAPAGLADSLPCGSAVQVQQPGGSEAMRNLFVPG